MSTTTNTQSFLPYIFRPTYGYSANAGFKTSFNIRNVDNITAGSLTIGQLQIGDSNSNMYIGSSTTESANILTNNNTSNTIIGVNAALGVSNTTGLEAVGFGAGGQAKYITNSSFVGQSAGCNAYTVTNSLFMGATAGSNSSNISNSLFIGAGTGVYNSNASNVIAIGVGTSAWSTKTTVGISNIFIGNSSATGLSGSNNILIGHGINSVAIANAPYTFTPGGAAQQVPATFSNKLFIGSGSNILLSGDFVSGCVSIGSTNSTPNSLLASYSIINGQSVPSWNALPPSFGLQLDVNKYARIGYGLGIGTDPGAYALDVNGQFRVSDGSGLIAMSNQYDGNGNNSGATNASFVEMKPTEASAASGGSMVLSVTGKVRANDGVYSYQSGTTGVRVNKGTPLALFTLPSKNGSNWTGLLVGTVINYSAAASASSNYYTASLLINAGVLQNPNSANTNGIYFTYASSVVSLIIDAGAAATSVDFLYNFTLYPAF